VENIEITTEKGLKKFVAENRKNITNINDVEFREYHPMLTLSNKHASYYSVEEDGNIFLYAPFKITVKK